MKVELSSYGGTDLSLRFEVSANLFQNHQVGFAPILIIVIETRRIDEGHTNAIGHGEFVFFNLRGLRLQVVSNIRNLLADNGVDELSERQEWWWGWKWSSPYRRFPSSSPSHNSVAVVRQLNTQRERLH